MTVTGADQRLQGALEDLREAVVGARFPLDLPGAPSARRSCAQLGGQLDDYVLPRIRRLDAPLLTVVGGSTGAGKSTLVNSLVHRQVSAAGVLRPTTRAPVLVCNPADEPWFAGDRVLPALRRTGVDADGSGTGRLRLISLDTLPPGLAVLDAPDIDSVVEENRELAGQLLAAADLWLFVTTAARYADAVPWDLLHTASERSTAVAIVLDRVPVEARGEVSTDLARMLADRGLGEAPMFIVPEATTAEGLLPETSVGPVRDWLAGLAADAAARDAVVRRTLDGAIASLPDRTHELADHADAQANEAAKLSAAVDEAYAEAVRSVDEATRDGSLLRGEVLARWQDFVGTGELLRSLEAQVGRVRDRVTAALMGRPQPGEELKVALETGVEALVRAQADAAAEGAARAWRARPAGAALLASAGQDLARASEPLVEASAREVREWQGYVLDLVREQASSKRATARLLSFGVNGLGLVLMVAIFAHTGGLTGAEVGVAGGTSLLSQKLLEALFGDQAVRQLADQARIDLRTRVQKLLDGEADRFRAVLRARPADPGLALELRAAGRGVRTAWRGGGR